MNVRTIYISGPMSGKLHYNFEAFNEAATFLRAKGYGVINPADFGVAEGEQWGDCLRRDLAVLLGLRSDDLVVTLPGWEHSKGARLEVTVARELGIGVAPYEDFRKLKDDGQDELLFSGLNVCDEFYFKCDPSVFYVRGSLNFAKAMRERPDDITHDFRSRVSWPVIRTFDSKKLKDSEAVNLKDLGHGFYELRRVPLGPGAS